MRRKRLAGAALLATLLPALTGCPGPKPVVVRQDLHEPERPGEPYRLIVEIENRGRGEGEAEVIARLRPRGSAETAAQETQPVQLNGHETARIDIPLRPTGTGPFDAEVEAQYPPE
jgi:hypothetical protein